MDLNFDSINPYQTLVAIVGDSPEDLVAKLRAQKTPIRIVAIVPWYAQRQVAYVMGDIRVEQTKPIKPKREK